MNLSRVQPPIWVFGATSISISTILYISNSITLESAVLLSVFFGLPTWFIGLLMFGIKSDKLLGVEGAFDYETPANTNDKV